MTEDILRSRRLDCENAVMLYGPLLRDGRAVDRSQGSLKWPTLHTLGVESWRRRCAKIRL
jgi:hypothetical protein